MDLTGDYARGFAVGIEGGVGEAAGILSSDVGARVEAEGAWGKINAEGLQREGEAYVNDAFRRFGRHPRSRCSGRHRGDQPGGGLRLLWSFCCL